MWRHKAQLHLVILRLYSFTRNWVDTPARLFSLICQTPKQLFPNELLTFRIILDSWKVEKPHVSREKKKHTQTALQTLTNQVKVWKSCKAQTFRDGEIKSQRPGKSEKERKARFTSFFVSQRQVYNNKSGFAVREKKKKEKKEGENANWLLRENHRLWCRTA